MFKCIGVCSKCGRCVNSDMVNDANGRKTRMLTYPEGFVPDKDGNGFGVAFDIGTTTVVGMLWNLTTGEQLAAVARTNPQNEFGMDVISRITYCRESENALGKLRNKITDCMNEMVSDLCSKVGACSEKITKAVVCGNTTMSHLFAGYSPISLALAPFTPAYEGTLQMRAAEAQLKLNKIAEVTVIPNIAGHVGGDITAGIVAARLLEMGSVTLFIDIGTNGEIVLTDGVRSLACSTAAGPAFEGAAIKYGMRAASGAIEKIKIDKGEVLFSVIGEDEHTQILPQGICGSGLIDAIAQMLASGVIDKKGRLASADEAEKKGFDPSLAERLIETENGREFILAKQENEANVVITQNDIREVQLAKGAISAGTQIMLKQLGKTVDDIDKVIVAGAFGNCIDKESAVKIGILPDVALEKIISGGNTAGAGVSMALACKKEMELAEKIPSIIEHVELAENPDFQMVYLKAMEFKA